MNILDKIIFLITSKETIVTLGYNGSPEIIFKSGSTFIVDRYLSNDRILQINDKSAKRTAGNEEIDDEKVLRALVDEMAKRSINVEFCSELFEETEAAIRAKYGID